MNITNNVRAVFTPNKSIDTNSKSAVIAFWLVSMLFLWVYSGSRLIPGPLSILKAWQSLFENGFGRDLITSTWFCIKAMGYAAVISLFLAYLSVLPFFRPVSSFIGKTRFLSTAGLTFLFMEMTPDTEHQKVSVLVFAVTVFVTTAACSIIANVTKDELDYGRTMKMSEWEIVWEIIILGKIDQMLEVIRQNFAIAWMMLAMVENLCRVDGGIGVILFDKNKHFQLDAVYAIQFTVLIVGIVFDWFLGFLKNTFCPYSTLTLERK